MKNKLNLTAGQTGKLWLIIFRQDEAKNAGIAVATSSIFNEVLAEKNKHR